MHEAWYGYSQFGFSASSSRRHGPGENVGRTLLTRLVGICTGWRSGALGEHAAVCMCC